VRWIARIVFLYCYAGTVAMIAWCVRSLLFGVTEKAVREAALYVRALRLELRA
jgi:hypothetical protein